jgi:hypothetical protein
MRTLRRFVESDDSSAGWQRAGTATVGLLLWWFGVVAFGDHVPFLGTHPAAAPGIGGNGLLASLCLLAGASLIVAAIRGGTTATTTATGIGLGCLVLGFASLFVLGTGINVLAVTLPDTLLGMVAGFVLLALGVGRTTSTRVVRRSRPQQQRGAAG